MKVKTSVTISEELLKEIDSIVTGSGNRSGFIERAVRAYIEIIKRQLRNRKDLEIINKSADSINKEAEDILSYQVKF